MKKLVRALILFTTLNFILFSVTIVVLHISRGGDTAAPIWINVWGFSWLLCIPLIGVLSIVAWWEDIRESITSFLNP